MVMTLYHRKLTGISPQNPYFKLLCIGFVCLIFYFIWMDIALYVNLQRWTPPAQTIEHQNKTINEKITLNSVIDKNNKQDPFSTFNPLTVKLIMIDHMTHYVHDILARFLVDFMGLARLFPWMSANFVSFAGLFLAMIGSKLMISDNLMHRQLGAVLFECRNLADSLDGVFSRSQKREHAEYIRVNHIKEKAEVVSFSSNYGTFGYNVDIICDILGGAFFCMAIFYRFVRRPPQIYENIHNDNGDNFPMIKVNDDSDSQNIQFKPNKVSENVKEAFAAHTEPTNISNKDSRYFTSRQVKIIVISFGLRILITGFLWDKYVHKYHDMLEVFSDNLTQRKLQGQAFKSISMWLIMWFWRIANGCALLEHLVIATFFDKLWEYLVFTTYIGWGFLCILTLFTQLHYTELYDSLNRLEAFT